MKVRFVSGPHKGSVAWHEDAQAKELIKSGVAVAYVRDRAVVERDRQRRAAPVAGKAKRGR
ncbi:MAG: hypothetical protein HY323_07335 [Betaproteobacteria bacterium]|nr:hypothetical protein [Betaproteobacteria bacterium]